MPKQFCFIMNFIRVCAEMICGCPFQVSVDFTATIKLILIIAIYFLAVALHSLIPDIF